MLSLGDFRTNSCLNYNLKNWKQQDFSFQVLLAYVIRVSVINITKKKKIGKFNIGVLTRLMV